MRKRSKKSLKAWELIQAHRRLKITIHHLYQSHDQFVREPTKENLDMATRQATEMVHAYKNKLHVFYANHKKKGSK